MGYSLEQAQHRKVRRHTLRILPRYNAIMLIRILVDNPGHTFTRNIDAKFVATVKDLRQTRDSNVQGFLRQTLDALEMQRGWDEDLAPLLQMWTREKTKLKRTNSGVCTHVLLGVYLGATVLTVPSLEYLEVPGFIPDFTATTTTSSGLFWPASGRNLAIPG
ncbi:unnamed protein product [Aspergillus oryzae]|nr:unnamed protein product [Aspergillus oryzae]